MACFLMSEVGILWKKILSILSDFLSWKQLTQKKVSHFSKIQFLNYKIAKCRMAYFGINVNFNIQRFKFLKIVLLFCFSFSKERKSERIERDFFSQNPNLIRWNCSLHFSAWPFPIRKTLWYWLRLRWTIQVANIAKDVFSSD